MKKIIYCVKGTKVLNRNGEHSMGTSEKSFVYRIMAVMGGLIFLTVIVLETVWLYAGKVLEENTDKEIRHLL